MSWTTPQEIIDNWIGDDKPTDSAQIQRFINKVEAQIVYRYPAIQERIDEGSIPLAVITGRVSDLITDYLKTEGTPYSAMSQSAGPFSKSVTFKTNARYSLTLSDADLSAFAPQGGDKSYSVDSAVERRHANRESLGEFNYYFWNFLD